MLRTMWLNFRPFPSIWLNCSSRTCRALQSRRQSHAAKPADTFLTVYSLLYRKYMIIPAWCKLVTFSTVFEHSDSYCTPTWIYLSYPALSVFLYFWRWLCLHLICLYSSVRPSQSQSQSALSLAVSACHYCFMSLVIFFIFSAWSVFLGVSACHHLFLIQSPALVSVSFSPVAGCNQSLSLVLCLALYFLCLNLWLFLLSLF